MQEPAMRQLIAQYTDAYNRFDVDAMLSTLHKDIRFENISDGKVTLSTTGIEAFREQPKKQSTSSVSGIKQWKISYSRA